jgi:hypothetical protein
MHLPSKSIYLVYLGNIYEVNLWRGPPQLGDYVRLDPDGGLICVVFWIGDVRDGSGNLYIVRQEDL